MSCGWTESTKKGMNKVCESLNNAQQEVVATRQSLNITG